MRARALGVMTLAIGAHPLGMVCGGALAVAVSASTAVQINGLVGLGLLVVVLVLYAGLRRYRG